MDNNVTTGEIRQCLELLKKADGFLTAAEIAKRLRLGGGRETQRRHVRAIVDVLRKQGQWIIAVNPEGYFLTADKAVWGDYLEGRKIDGKRVIGAASRRQRAAVDASGQGLLFMPSVGCGRR